MPDYGSAERLYEVAGRADKIERITGNFNAEPRQYLPDLAELVPNARDRSSKRSVKDKQIFDLLQRRRSQVKSERNFLFALQRRGLQIGICSERRQLLGSRNSEFYWLLSNNLLLVICFGPLYWFRPLCILFE